MKDTSLHLATKDNYKNFDIDAGIYKFDSIIQFEKLFAYAGTKDARISKVIESIPLEVAINGRRIKPQHVFPTTYPWDALKTAFTEGLTTFGNYCSIIIGILTILVIIKNIYVYMYGCIMAKKVDGGYQNIITYALSPMSFVLKKLPRQVEPTKSKKHMGEYSTIGNTIPPEEVMQQAPVCSAQQIRVVRHPLQNNQGALQELRRLNDELPNYQQGH